jgi:hypothetical protein
MKQFYLGYDYGIIQRKFLSSAALTTATKLDMSFTDTVFSSFVLNLVHHFGISFKQDWKSAVYTRVHGVSTYIINTLEF